MKTKITIAIFAVGIMASYATATSLTEQSKNTEVSSNSLAKQLACGKSGCGQKAEDNDDCDCKKHKVKKHEHKEDCKGCQQKKSGCKDCPQKKSGCKGCPHKKSGCGSGK